MFELKVISSFSAAHFLENYKGKCEALHGHNWRVEVVISSPHVGTDGMVIDFKIIKDMLNKVISQLDHCLLNDLLFFKKKSTTSEMIAKYIYDEFNKQLLHFRMENKRKSVRLKKVMVWEQDNSCAIYYPKQKQ